MYDGNFLKFGGSIHYDMKMDWLEFGFQRSKGEVTTGPIWAKIQFWSHSSLQMYQVATFVNGKDLLGQCQAFLEIWGAKVKYQDH